MSRDQRTGPMMPALCSAAPASVLRPLTQLLVPASQTEECVAYPILARAACSLRSLCSLAIEALIDRRDLLHPTAPLGMLQGHDLIVRPVEVIGDEGYLLVERLEGVA